MIQYVSRSRRNPIACPIDNSIFSWERPAELDSWRPLIDLCHLIKFPTDIVFTLFLRNIEELCEDLSHFKETCSAMHQKYSRFIECFFSQKCYAFSFQVIPCSLYEFNVEISGSGGRLKKRAHARDESCDSARDARAIRVEGRPVNCDPTPRCPW